MHWLQNFYAQPSFSNVAGSIAAYAFCGWTFLYSLIVSGWHEDEWDGEFDRVTLSMFWPAGLAWFFILIPAYHAFWWSVRPAEILRDTITRHKCLSCNRRIPFASSYCPKCGRKAVA